VEIQRGDRPGIEAGNLQPQRVEAAASNPRHTRPARYLVCKTGMPVEKQRSPDPPDAAGTSSVWGIFTPTVWAAPAVAATRRAGAT
jgi:hypothetical protein